MTIVLILLAAIVLMDALRMRSRADKLAVLAPSDEPATHVALGSVTDSTLRAASAYMRANAIDILDIVPQDLP
ncbi:MAG TPA: hypothetical protein VGG28_08045, partial [Kofleriaceae bacterium]